MSVSPTDVSAPAISVLIGTALRHLQARQFDSAEALLEQALTLDADDCDTLHLFGQMRRVQERFEEAERFYRRALEIEPARPQLLLHLGQLLGVQGRFDEAERALNDALHAKPNFTEAYLELGNILSRQDKPERAEAAYRGALRLQPNLVVAKQALSAVLIGLKRPKDSEVVARNAIQQLGPDQRRAAPLRLNLAIALSEQRRYNDAMAQFTHVLSTAPELPQLHYNLANTFQCMGRLAEAEGAYRQAVTRDPSDLRAHASLNQLLYRLERQDFLQSYDAAMGACPDNPALPIEKAKFLYLADRYEEAGVFYAKALTLAPDSLAASNGYGSVLTRTGRYSEATEIFERLTRLAPDNPEIRCNFADCLLQMSDWGRARAEAEAAIARDRYDQLALALWGLALRGLDDPRECELNNYDDFVQIVDLEAPEGYSNIADFNAELANYLASLHLDSREHINQTSRLGTKTLGALFGAGHDLVEKLKRCIDEALHAYIARMADRPDHPLLGRRQNGFDYRGSWSTTLKDCGYHVNHVHPRGWISSAYYVALPDVMSDEMSQQGWFKLGEPAGEKRPPPRRVVRPIPGRLVLFPSYMWHGTIPFHSNQTRTTVAFDAVPSGIRVSGR